MLYCGSRRGRPADVLRLPGVGLKGGEPVFGLSNAF